jgi:ribonuclease HI
VGQGGHRRSGLDPLNFDTGHPIYTDGSCKHPYSANALSAGAAVTLAEGTPHHGTYHAVGLITANLKYTSFFGEVAGLIAALELSDPMRRNGKTTVIYSDNMAAVTGINRLLSEQTMRWRGKCDGLWALVLSNNNAWSQLELHKVKAHQALHADTPDALVPHIIGNMIADQVANKVIDYFLPRGLPTAANVREALNGPLHSHIGRLLALREQLLFSVQPV